MTDSALERWNIRIPGGIAQAIVAYLACIDVDGRLSFGCIAARHIPVTTVSQNFVQLSLSQIVDLAEKLTWGQPHLQPEDNSVVLLSLRCCRKQCARCAFALSLAAAAPDFSPSLRFYILGSPLTHISRVMTCFRLFRVTHRSSLKSRVKDQRNCLCLAINISSTTSCFVSPVITHRP